MNGLRFHESSIVIEILIVNPTGPFPILKPRDQEIGKFYVVQARRTTNFEAPELLKGRSGSYFILFCFQNAVWSALCS